MLDGNDVLALKPGKLRALRWVGASIIFQGAMHALNPVQRVGDQIAEAMMVHGQAHGKEAGSGPGELLERVEPQAPTSRRLPARALGRAEAAGHDRDGARLQPARW